MKQLEQAVRILTQGYTRQSFWLAITVMFSRKNNTFILHLSTSSADDVANMTFNVDRKYLQMLFWLETCIRWMFCYSVKGGKLFMLVENMKLMSNVEQLVKVSVVILIKITLQRLIHTGEAFHSVYFCMRPSMTVVWFHFFFLPCRKLCESSARCEVQQVSRA